CATPHALRSRPLGKERRIFYLVPPSDYRRQETCLIENVVAARQQRLADLKSREGTRFKSDNAVPASSEQRAGHAPCGPSTDDQGISVHQVVIRRACVRKSFAISAFLRSVPLDKIRRESTESESKHTAHNQATREQLQKEIEYPSCLGCAAHALQGYWQPVAMEQDSADLRIGKQQQRSDRGR